MQKIPMTNDVTARIQIVDIWDMYAVSMPRMQARLNVLTPANILCTVRCCSRSNPMRMPMNNARRSFSMKSMKPGSNSSATANTYSV